MPSMSAMICARPSSVSGYARSFFSCSIRSLTAAKLAEQRVHLGFDPRDLLQTDVVNRIGSQISGRIAAEVVGVRFGSPVQPPEPGVIVHARPERFEKHDRPLPGGIDLIG